MNYWTPLAYFMYVSVCLDQHVNGQTRIYCYSGRTTLECAESALLIQVKSLVALTTTPSCKGKGINTNTCQQEAMKGIGIRCNNRKKCELPGDMQLSSCGSYILEVTYLCQHTPIGTPPATSSPTARFTTTDNPVSRTNTNDIRTTTSSGEKTASTSSESPSPTRITVTTVSTGRPRTPTVKHLTTKPGSQTTGADGISTSTNNWPEQNKPESRSSDLSLSVGLPLALIFLTGVAVTVVILVLRFRKKRQASERHPDRSGLNNPNYFDVAGDDFLAIRGKPPASNGLHVNNEEANVTSVKEPAYLEVFGPEITKSDQNDHVQNHLRHACPFNVQGDDVILCEDDVVVDHSHGDSTGRALGSNDVMVDNNLYHAHGNPENHFPGHLENDGRIPKHSVLGQRNDYEEIAKTSDCSKMPDNDSNTRPVSLSNPYELTLTDNDLYESRAESGDRGSSDPDNVQLRDSQLPLKRGPKTGDVYTLVVKN